MGRGTQPAIIVDVTKGAVPRPLMRHEDAFAVFKDGPVTGALARLPGRVATTLPRPQGDVFYCSPEALLCQETDPRSDLFSLGLVLLELATWGHLYSLAHLRPSDLERALTGRGHHHRAGRGQVADELELG